MILPRFAQFGILAYLRYFDDLFFIFNSRSAMLEFFEFFQRRTKYFRYKVRDISSTCVQNLDMTIKVESSALLIYPTLDKLPLPLAVESAHPMHVHSAWPGAVRNRTIGLSDMPSTSLEQLTTIYELAGSSPYTVDRLRASPLLRPRVLDSSPILSKVCCILRYHPVYQQVLRRTLSLVPLPPHIRVVVQPSFRNALRAISTHDSRSNGALGCGNADPVDQAIQVVGASLLSSRGQSSTFLITSARVANLTLARINGIN